MFDLTQVIGFSNNDSVSTEFRWVKQVVEQLNPAFNIKNKYRL